MKSFHCFLAVVLTVLLLAVPLGSALRPAPTPSQPRPLFDNQPPDLPRFTGPHAGAPAFDLAFTVNATDPDGDQVYFKIDWGDGNLTDWLGPVNSSAPIITHYSWYTEGNYTILVLVKDSQGLEHNGSLAFNISIAPQIWVTNIIPGYVYLGQSFFYLDVLSIISAVVVLTTATSLPVNVSTTANIAKVTATTTLIKNGAQVNETDDNASDGYHFNLTMKTGLYSLLFLAYDADGNLIDGYLFNFVLYLQFGTMNAAHRLLAHHTHL